MNEYGHKSNEKFYDKTLISQKAVQKEARKIQVKNFIAAQEVEYASMFYRALAWCIDIIIVLGILLALNAYNPLLFRINFGMCFFLGICFMGSSVGFICFFIIGFFYYWIMELYNKGQTIGKMLLKLRTVNEATLNLTSPYRYALDSLTKANFLLLFDLLRGLTTLYKESPQKQARYSQILAKTVVVRSKLEKKNDKQNIKKENE